MNSKNGGLNFPRLGNTVWLCGVAGLFLISVSTARANWEIGPAFGAGVGFDDNVRLETTQDTDETETYFGLNAELNIEYNTQLTRLKMRPRVTSKRFENDSELDADDLFLRFDYAKEGMKSSFRMRGDLAKEAVRTGERLLVDFETENPDDIETDNAGQVISTGERDRIWVVPEFEYELSKRYSLGISGNYLKNSYDSRSSQFLSGYQDYGLDTSLTYNWSEKDSAYVYVGANNYETETVGEDSKSNEMGLGYNRRLTERTRFKVRLGASSTENDQGSDDTNAVGQISVVQRYQRSTAFASYRRSVSGSGDGGQSLVDSFNFNFRRPLTPLITMNLGAYGYTSERFTSGRTIDRDYIQARASMVWSLTRNISLDLDYRFTHIKRTEDDFVDNEDSNEISFWITWSPNPLIR